MLKLLHLRMEYPHFLQLREVLDKEHLKKEIFNAIVHAQAIVHQKGQYNFEILSTTVFKIG
jgi:hypothetical protein